MSIIVTLALMDGLISIAFLATIGSCLEAPQLSVSAASKKTSTQKAVAIILGLSYQFHTIILNLVTITSSTPFSKNQLEVLNFSTPTYLGSTVGNLEIDGDLAQFLQLA